MYSNKIKNDNLVLFIVKDSTKIYIYLNSDDVYINLNSNFSDLYLKKIYYW